MYRSIYIYIYIYISGSAKGCGQEQMRAEAKSCRNRCCSNEHELLLTGLMKATRGPRRPKGECPMKHTPCEHGKPDFCPQHRPRLRAFAVAKHRALGATNLVLRAPGNHGLEGPWRNVVSEEGSVRRVLDGTKRCGRHGASMATPAEPSPTPLPGRPPCLARVPFIREAWEFRKMVFDQVGLEKSTCLTCSWGGLSINQLKQQNRSNGRRKRCVNKKDLVKRHSAELPRLAFFVPRGRSSVGSRTLALAFSVD